jgi:hypothetical protein
MPSVRIYVGGFPKEPPQRGERVRAVGMVSVSVPYDVRCCCTWRPTPRCCLRARVSVYQRAG